MIKFYLPNFYKYYELYFYLFDLLLGHKDFFYDNIKIGAVYGSVPGALWNGGRAVLGYQPDDDEYAKIKWIIDEFNARDIPIRFTWTNSMLTEEYYKDFYCNKVMKIASKNGFNEVLVSDDQFENFLRTTYPKFKYISSTTKCITDEDKILEECQKDYYLVVLDWRKNRDYNLLEKLPKDKIEILVNNKCYPDCPRVESHYKFMSYKQLENEYDKETDIFNNCRAGYGCLYDMLETKPMMLKTEDIYGKYLDMGFTNWKIEGRQESFNVVIESIVYYMVKPQYRDRIRQYLLTFWCQKNDFQ